MPDITMCLGKDCPKKEKCFRYKAKPSEYMQAYSDFKPENDKCEGFWEIEEEE